MSQPFKTKRPRRYTEEALKDALSAVENGMGLREAARVFKVPRNTVSRYVQDTKARRLGKERKLNDFEEGLLVDLLKKFGNTGFSLNKTQLRIFVDEMGIAKASNVDRKKAREWTVEGAESWIELLGGLNDQGYLSNPKGIINLDESGFVLGFERERVYAEKGKKHVVSYTEGSTRDQVTTLLCGNAAGRVFKPLVLFDGVLHLGSMYDNTKDKLYVAVNRSGVMDHKVLTDYVRQEVLPNAPDKCVVLMDGHYSRVTNIQLFKLSIESGKDICLIRLPSGQTDKLQPLDSCPFGTMKPKWTAYKSFHRINPQFECLPPDVIRRTVDKELIKYDEPSLPVLDRESSPMKKVAAILRSDKVKMDDAMVEASLESIDHIRSGYKSVADTVLSAAGKAFAFSKPKKQRKAKDTRIVLEAGTNMLNTPEVTKRAEQNYTELPWRDDRKGMAREPSPSACLPVPDIPSTSGPKSMPKNSRKKKVRSPEEPSACPLSNADVGTYARTSSSKETYWVEESAVASLRWL
ncbi:hypothetical protein RvY_02709 [Ramazzottius varieornatus]|uniref:HTH psq-type domain-containing protein n=3 Tax=Ramazzottius varieornatus TaxID=947166 RepID=A0A1D1ULG2_RAMVA|nr:hypothetical protein RvY_02709 [Ramazzottius varieornatus]